MPIMNKRERVEAVMVYLHNHKYERNTADHLAKQLDIPIATLRKTLTQDYPECFDRDSHDRRVITLNQLVWPDGRPFDLEPGPQSGEQQFRAEHLNDSALSLFSDEAQIMLRDWAVQGIAGNKRAPKEYYTLMNTVNLMSVLLRVLRSTSPNKRLKELVDKPDELRDNLKDYIHNIEKGLNDNPGREQRAF